MKISIFRSAAVLLTAICFAATALHAQTLYRYEDLSARAYAKQKDSLQKAWSCPSLYTAKATQKKFKELWDGRTDFISGAITAQRYVQEPEIHRYLTGILSQLVSTNKNLITSQPLLLIDRSSAVNAYAVGHNLMAVNLGLVSFAQSREELALVLAHELSHNLLDHAERSMRERAEWLTSAEYDASLKEVLATKYERLSKLKKIHEDYRITNSRHNRYHESDADSLAIVLLKNSGIGFDAAFFLRLDSADRIYHQPLNKAVPDYFSGYGLSFENSWVQKKTKGLSSRSYNFDNQNSKLEDSLKTHPDCVLRHDATLQYTTPGLKLTPIPASVAEKANRIIIWNLFDNMDLTQALYRVLLEKDRGATDEWYDFMLANVVAGLHHADKTLRRFNAIGVVQKEYVCKSYYELQTALEQVPKDGLQSWYTGLQSGAFWQKLPADAKGMKTLMASLIASVDNPDMPAKKSAAGFIQNFGSSMYCEFAAHFTDK